MSETTGAAPEIPSYVMVPIPDVYVPAVMQHVLMLMAKETVQQWEPDEVVKFFADSDEIPKAVLSAVARGTLATGDVIADDVAQKTQVLLGEVNRIVREVNEQARGMLRPSFIEHRTGNELLANGREIKRRYLDMHERLAQLVVDAEKADLEANPHVLPGSE